MTRSQLLFSLAGLVLVIVIYRLPRVVVENETDAEVAVETHDFTISSEDAAAIQSLRLSLTDPNEENLGIFADSLARYYLRYGFLDSASNVSQAYLVEDSSLINRKKGIAILYAVFERSLDQIEAADKSKELRPYIEQALSEDPADLTLKNKLAMTLVTTENPMAGITLLREIVSIDPENREALINLGLLSMRSGQFDRAVGRFETLLELDTADHESKLYLAIASIEVGDEEKSDRLLNEIIQASNVDPAIRQSALEYLERD